jgi:hypothetical protein
LRDNQQGLLPFMLRELLKLHPFRTRGRRMGKVARIRAEGIDYWQFHQAQRMFLPWPEHRF